MTPKKHVTKGLASAYSVRDEHFGWVNMGAITFSFVDQSSSRSLEKFGEDTPTSPEVIGAHTLNFRANFIFFH